jgi:hypothetical protein
LEQHPAVSVTSFSSRSDRRCTLANRTMLWADFEAETRLLSACRRRCFRTFWQAIRREFRKPLVNSSIAAASRLCPVASLQFRDCR